MLACVCCRGGWEEGLYLQLGFSQASFLCTQYSWRKKLTLSSLLPLFSSPSPLFSLFSPPSSFSFPPSPLILLVLHVHTPTRTRDLEAELSSETTLQSPTSPQPPASPHSEVGERESTPISVVDSSASKQHSPTPTSMVRVCLSVCRCSLNCHLTHFQ